MLIVSQDKTQIVKLKEEMHIRNVGFAFEVYIDCNQMGTYENQKRAEEVLRELINAYQKTQFYKYGTEKDQKYIVETLDDVFVYQMPKE